jgi:hypothetical protein
MLYPAELRVQQHESLATRFHRGRAARLRLLLQSDRFLDGRGRGIRTPDPLLPKQMRYQTAPCPVRKPARTGRE